MFFERVVKDNNPKGLWLLSETAGATASDSSGNAQNGSIKNGPTLGVAGPIPEFGAITLNGTNQWISVPDSATVDLGDVFTYAAWFKRSATGGTDCLLDKGPNAAILRFDGEDRLLFRRNSVADICKSTTKIVDFNWHHVVATKNGATVKLYLDGVDVTGSVTNSTCTNTAVVLSIGASEAGAEDFFRGSLAGVAVFATAIAEARVKAHFDAGTRLLAMVV
jgi:hypothetical protein